MTSWPCSASSAAATDESTPPDIATTMRTVVSITEEPRSHEKHEGSRRRFVYGTCFVPLRVPCVFVVSLCQSAKFLDEPRQDLDDAVDLCLCRVDAEAEAERVLRPVWRKAHRSQHVRRFERSRRASRSGRHGHAFQVEGD